MSAFAWVAIGFLSYLTFTSFLSFAIENERFREAFGIQAVGSGGLLVVTLVVWALVSMFGGPSEPEKWDVCTSQGNIWHKENGNDPQYKGLCYTQEQYKLIKE